MTIRALRRAVALALTIAWCMACLGLMRLCGPLTLERRGRWAQWGSRLILAALGIHFQIEGQPPQRGVVVANHLSYLDILILSAAMPCCFVAKAEIDKWPVFGWISRCSGTLFIDRASLASAQKVSDMIADRLALSLPVLFFPEGTSSDGSSLLRFHSRLFEPAILAEAPVTAASVRYILHDGTPERELCWFGDDAFLPHLWKALGVLGFSAEVRFGEPQVYPHRRVAAETTHAEIRALRNGDAMLQPSMTAQG
jgi:1-acyl-sn-glycerol-3-phosphate acyltransferase